MAGIPLRIAEPTGRYRRSLRRYRSTFSGDGACPSGGHCDASALIGEVGEDEADAHGDNWPHDDLRWPRVCVRCGCAFTPGDQWQLVILPDDGTWITTQSATGGGYWTVTGTPPAITVTPSIFHNSPHGWHGFITNGELVSC